MTRLVASLLRFIANRLDPPQPDYMIVHFYAEQTTQALMREIARQAAMN